MSLPVESKVIAQCSMSSMLDNETFADACRNNDTNLSSVSNHNISNTDTIDEVLRMNVRKQKSDHFRAKR